VTGATDDGWEDSSGSVIAGEPGLAHTGPIVHHQRSNVVVTHIESCLGFLPAQNQKIVISFFCSAVGAYFANRQAPPFPVENMWSPLWNRF